MIRSITVLLGCFGTRWAVNDGMSSEHFFWNVQIHTAFFYVHTVHIQFILQRYVIIYVIDYYHRRFAMINILIVEDNEQLRKLMCIHLTREGYNVFESGNGVEALKVLEDVSIHLIIADIMMPKMDGYELTGELRSANITIPVLMVTARETLEDKRKGFKTGVDDYMVKPIDFDEMLLRVEALLRRSNLSSEHILMVGATSLDSDALMVNTGDQSISLPQKEFYLLQLLLSYPKKIFTRQTLMDEIWGYDSETDPRTVDVHIKRLREKFLHSEDFEIETVRGLGYKAVIKK